MRDGPVMWPDMLDDSPAVVAVGAGQRPDLEMRVAQISFAWRRRLERRLGLCHVRDTVSGLECHQVVQLLPIEWHLIHVVREGEIGRVHWETAGHVGIHTGFKARVRGHVVCGRSLEGKTVGVEGLLGGEGSGI